MTVHDKPFPFIVCYPRSGSTMLRLMLDCHPEMAVPPETHFCDLFGLPSLLQPVSSALRMELLQRIVAHPRWNDFNLEECELMTALNEVPEGAVSGGRCLAAFWKLYATKRGKSRWGDKTPQHLLCSAKIASALPETHFIHLVRDGRDVACSFRESWFGKQASIVDVARDWVERLARFEAESSAFLHRTITVRYEDLVSNPSKTLQDICHFIEIDYSGDMLLYYKGAESRMQELQDLKSPNANISRDTRAGIHENVKIPPMMDRIGRWKSQFDRDSERMFNEIAGEMLSRYGYQTR